MAHINKNFLKLPGGYLFPEIRRRVQAFSAEKPPKPLIRLGIGDVTQPLAPAVIEAMEKAVAEMGKKETFRGYCEETCGAYDFLRFAIRESYQARGVDIADDEIFVSDGAKSDCGNIGDIFGVENSLTPAMDLFTKLGYLGLTCRLNTDAYLQQIGAGHLPHGAVAVAFSHSGSSADTVKALRLAKSHGAKTIAITNAIGAPLASWADVTLLTGRDSHTIYGNAIFSRVADTALVDMLYMGVILSDYGRFSTALDESGRMIRDRVFEN